MLTFGVSAWLDRKMKAVNPYDNILDFLQGLFIFLPVLFISINPAMASKPNVINFYKDTYKAANKNWAIAQDSSGIMYFGNDKGLLEFDGIRWKLYALQEAEVVRAVAVSSDNLIFTGGYEEFGLWKRDTFGDLIYISLSKNLKKEEEIHNDDIWKILVTDSLVYFQSFGHIYEYDYKNVRVVNTNNQGVLFLMHVYDDFFIQKMGGELCQLTSNGLKVIPESAFLGNTEIKAMLPFSDKRYLVGTSTMGLYIYDGKTFTPWDSEFSRLIKPFQLNNGILLKNGHYFFGSILNGLYEVNRKGEVVNHFSSGNLLQNNTVLSLYEDEGNNVWVALDRGISYIQYLRDMDCYTDYARKAGAIYSAAFFGGNLFLGTNQGVYYLPTAQLYSTYALNYLKFVEGTQGQIWDLKVVNDQLLCGHNAGLIVIDKDIRVKTFRSPGIYCINPIRQMNTDLLMLGAYTTLIIASPDYKTLTRFNHLREPVTRIETDHLGNIWLEHAQKGLYRYRFSGKADSITCHGVYGGGIDDGLPFHINLFRIGNRVVFYGNNTFFVYNDIENKIVKYKELNDCFANAPSLKNMVQISENYCLGVGNNCLYKLFYDGYEIRMEDKYDIGFSNISLVNRYENAAVLNDSLVLICLDNGFLLYHAKKDSEKTFFPQMPEIRSVTALNAKNKQRKIDIGEHTPLISYTHNNLVFTFFAKDILSRNLSFQYQLKGVNNDWSAPEKIDEVMYERLPKGEYTFLLRTVDNLGDFSEATTFTFRILPPWYANNWAYVGYFLMLLCMMAGIWFMMLRRYRNTYLIKLRMREERRLRRLNQNLQREIEEKNEELFSQASFIIQKNELIGKIMNEIDAFYHNYSGNKIFKPLYIKINSLLNKNMDMDEDWKMFLIQFEKKHTGFFKRMKEIEPDLTSNDLKLCACLKLNLSSKDVASLMNISLRSVENGRYRLRKKLNIPPGENLNEYFLKI